MGKKRRSDLEIVVNYFLTASLLDAETTLTVAKSIVAGRSPQAKPSVGRGKRDKRPAGVEDESIGNA